MIGKKEPFSNRSRMIAVLLRFTAYLFHIFGFFTGALGTTTFSFALLIAFFNESAILSWCTLIYLVVFTLFVIGGTIVFLVKKDERFFYCLTVLWVLDVLMFIPFVFLVNTDVVIERLGSCIIQTLLTTAFTIPLVVISFNMLQRKTVHSDQQAKKSS